MLRVFGDAESYYDKIYSLRVLSPIEYILDDRWETLGWAVCIEREDPIILPQDDIVRFLKDIKQPYCFISHNALFDACILSYKYDINPDAMLCTLSMARSLLLHEIPNGSISLANVLKHLGLHPKGDFIQSMAGVHWADLAADPARMVAWAGYTINDVIGCRDIFFALCDRLPGREALAMDRVLRMATQPKLTADGHALLKYNMQLRQRKQELMTLAGKDRSQLMSNPQLAALLLESGVEPPMKISKTTGNPTYAFAKTDAAFAELLEHDNPDVQALVAARLGVKTTIEETRSMRLYKITGVTQRTWGTPYLPVPLKIGGAHTHRLCLTGDHLIVILRDGAITHTRLDTLQSNDLIWDGDMFVRHGGLSYAGMKEVVTYDTITGTPDHRVWTLERGYCGLATAKARGYHIARGDIPCATRIDTTRYRTDNIPNQSKVHLRRVRQGDAVALGRLASPRTSALSVLPQTWAEYLERRTMGDGTASSYGSTPSLSKPIEGRLSELRGAGYRVPFSIGSGDGRVGATKPRAETDQRLVVYRSDRQRRTLRAGQSTVGNPATTERQQAVWDILDCGPHNRFMANGRIVHNSGDWQLNMQNLSSRKNRDIRNAIHAMAGYVIISVDASQIEARLVAWLSGQMNLLQQFANGEDVYRNFAAVVFHVPLADVTKVQRFICKTCILGLGFGMSAAALLTSILNGAREQGLDLGDMTLEMCEEWVVAYRYKQFPKISGYWKIMSALIESMEKGNADGVEVGPCRIEGTTVIGPSGLRLYYDNLRYEEDEYRYDYGRMHKKIYGGKFLENIVQHLDRQHVLEAGLRTEFAARKLGIPDPRVVLNEHDANVYCVPQEYGLTLAELALKEMRRNCLWNVGLPLGAEVKMGTCFGELEKVQF